MLVVDANIWTAAHVVNEPHYLSSNQWLLRLIRSGERLAAPRILLLEIAAGLGRPGNQSYRPAVEQRIRLAQVRWAEIDEPLINQAVIVADDLKLKALDCRYVATAELLNVPLVTWDTQVIERAASRIKVYQPV